MQPPEKPVSRHFVKTGDGYKMENMATVGTAKDERMIPVNKARKGRPRKDGILPKVSAAKLHEEFNEKIMDEEFLMMNDTEKAKAMGVSRNAIKVWKRTTDWESVATAYRKNYAQYKPMIDIALIKKAIRGSEKAMEMFYQKYEGWFAKNQLDINITREYDGLSNSKLVGELIKLMPLDEKQKLLEENTNITDVPEPGGEPGGGPGVETAVNVGDISSVV